MKTPVLALTFAVCAASHAQSVNTPRIVLDNWATGLVNPVKVLHAGDERLFAVERRGTIKIITDSMQVSPNLFLDIQTRVLSGQNEQGLLSMAFPPDHASTGVFYLYYTSNELNGDSRLSRFTLLEGNPQVGDPASEEVLMTFDQPYWNHNGGDLHFGPDGYLYLSLGDGGSGGDPGNRAQNLSSPLGKMLRLDVSDLSGGYSIPADNPFVDQGTALPEIWAYGLRNPWRFSFDRANGDLWIGDVGQNAWEEVDHLPAGTAAGVNFGWRCREGFVATPGVSQTGCGTAASYTAPVFAYPNSSTTGCTVVGGFVYRGPSWPHLEGRYIFLDHCFGDFMSYPPSGVVDTLLMTPTPGYASFGEDLAGELYVVLHSNSGVVRKIRDACPMDDPTATLVDGVLTASAGNGYQWFRNGVAISGATAQTYTPTQDGTYHVRVDLGTPCLLRSATVEVLVTSVPDMLATSLKVYPVPARNELFVERTKDMGADLLLQLVDMSGRTLGTYRMPGGEQLKRLNMADLANGRYVLQVTDVASDRKERLPVEVLR